MSHRTAKRQRFYAAQRVRRARGARWKALASMVKSQTIRAYWNRDGLFEELRSIYDEPRRQSDFHQHAVDAMLYGMSVQDGAGNRIDPRGVWRTG